MMTAHAAHPSSSELLDDLKRLHPLMIDLSLDRVIGLLDRLGNPQRHLPPVIHVAGTNGKGSTCAFVSAMLTAAGLKVHTYTSPHLIRFHERIALAGCDGLTRPIGERQLVELLTRVKDVNAGAQMTFYELTTAAAFLAFAETAADAVVLEVGLGGRLDATNVVERPAICVITPVSIDHADKLGNSLEAIAAEKAGILKANAPCVVGPQQPGARHVIERVATERGAPLYLWGQHFDGYAQAGRLLYQEGGALLDLPLPTLRGAHQLVNASVAIAAVRQLAANTDGFSGVDETAFARGLQAVNWPARMMRLETGPLVDLLGCNDELWVDGGHNPSAGAAVAQTLADLEERSPKPTYLVAGMMGQKDAEGFFAHFRDMVREVICVPVRGALDTPNPPDALADRLRAIGLRAAHAGSLEQALAETGGRSSTPKRVLICGSLYLAGEVLARQENAVHEPH